MNITDFLRARLDEDQAAATAASDGPWSVRVAGAGIRSSTPYAFVEQPDGKAAIVERHNGGTVADIDHIARHDPARALREVAAKRAIMAEHRMGFDPCDAHDAAMASIPCDTVRALASVYADHPDYDPTWT